MHITQITVSYGETQSLPEYSNVKPNLSLTAVLDAGDSAEAVEQALWVLAKSAVHEQIDLALEANGKAAKYSPEPRYQVLKTARADAFDRKAAHPSKLVVILPDGVKPQSDDYGARLVSAVYGESRNLRYAHALRLAHEAAENYDGATMLDCSDGDLAPLAAALPKPAFVADTLSDDDQRGYAMADAQEGDRDVSDDE